MTSPQRHLIGVAESLPSLSLPRADCPGTISWCHGTRASVLFFPHLGPCSGCDRYRCALAAIGEDLRLWDTRLLIVVAPGAAAVELAERSGPTVLLDHDGAARASLGITDDDAALIVADRWGAVYQVDSAGTEHCLPDPRHLIDLAKFIDIQCPECGVPGEEWRLSCPLPLG